MAVKRHRPAHRRSGGIICEKKNPHTIRISLLRVPSLPKPDKKCVVFYSHMVAILEINLKTAWAFARAKSSSKWSAPCTTTTQPKPMQTHKSETTAAEWKKNPVHKPVAECFAGASAVMDRPEIIVSTNQPDKPAPVIFFASLGDTGKFFRTNREIRQASSIITPFDE